MYAMKKLRPVVYAVLLIIPSLLMGRNADARETQTVDTLTLGAYVKEVLNANPEIKAMQAQVSADEARYHFTGVIPDPTLMFKINNMDTSYSVGNDPMSYFAVELDQSIPFPEKLHLESEISSKELEIGRQELHQRVLDVQSRAVSAFMDYYETTASLTLLRQYLKVIDTVIGTARQRYETGIASQQDLLSAMLERSRLRERIELAGFELQRARARMNSLLGRTPDGQFPRPGALEPVPQPYDKKQLYRSAESASPEITIAKIGVEKSRLELSQSKWSYAPDLDIGAGIMLRGVYPPGWEGQIGISLPLYFWTKQQYRVKAAHAGLTAAQLGEDNREKTVLAQIDAAYQEVRTTGELINLYNSEIIPQAALTFSSAISSYTTGRVDFLTAMDALLMLIDYKQMLYKRTADYYKALARLSTLSGVDLIKAER